MKRFTASLLVLGLCLAANAQAAKSLLVDLSKSTVYAIEDGKVVRALVINPGAEDSPTRPGRYRISQKVRNGYRSNLVDIHNKPLRKGGLGAPMDYWMRLGGTGMGFHRSSLWRPNGRWGSHGCLRMSRAGARWLHDWTPMGTQVTVVSGGTQYASAVKSPSRKRPVTRKSALAKAKPSKAKSVKAVKTAKVVKPAPSAVLAKKKPAPAKSVAVAPKPPAEPVNPSQEGPEPSVAPILTTDDEALSLPDTQD